MIEESQSMHPRHTLHGGTLRCLICCLPGTSTLPSFIITRPQISRSNVCGLLLVSIGHSVLYERSILQNDFTLSNLGVYHILFVCLLSSSSVSSAAGGWRRAASARTSRSLMVEYAAPQQASHKDEYSEEICFCFHDSCYLWNVFVSSELYTNFSFFHCTAKSLPLVW